MSIMKPTINVKAKNPKMAMYGHVLGLIGGALMAVLGLIGLLNNFNLGPLLAIILGIIVVIVELDYVKVAPLKDALIRGIVWIVIAVVTGISDILTGFVVLISGILYLIYHFN